MASLRNSFSEDRTSTLQEIVRVLNRALGMLPDTELANQHAYSDIIFDAQSYVSEANNITQFHS